mmetsp:Transcript_5136/g.11549  ORF Transcript_5136/g.11549 Transcript_5136/m.11549 type:complete len:229 (+) Transcript_5136:184-870(+)
MRRKTLTHTHTHKPKQRHTHTQTKKQNQQRLCCVTVIEKKKRPGCKPAKRSFLFPTRLSRMTVEIFGMEWKLDIMASHRNGGVACIGAIDERMDAFIYSFVRSASPMVSFSRHCLYSATSNHVEYIIQRVACGATMGMQWEPIAVFLLGTATAPRASGRSGPGQNDPPTAPPKNISVCANDPFLLGAQGMGTQLEVHCIVVPRTVPCRSEDAMQCHYSLSIYLWMTSE